MSAYIGINDIAKKIQSIYVGQNNIAKKVLKVYIGDSNNKSHLVYNYDNRNYKNPIWTSQNNKQYSSTNFPLFKSNNDNRGWSDIFTSDFTLESGDTYELIVTHSIITSEQFDSVGLTFKLMANSNIIKTLDMSYSGTTAIDRQEKISGIIRDDFNGSFLKLNIFVEPYGEITTSQSIDSIKLLVNDKYLINVE
mgnify:FL=1